MIELSAAAALTRELSAVGAFIGALEFVAARSVFAPDGVLSWDVFRTGRRIFALPWSEALADTFFDEPGMKWLHVAKAIAALLLLVPGLWSGIYAVCCLTIVIVTCATSFRSGLGGDGSDQMLVVVMAGLCAYYAAPGSIAGLAGAVFIGAQAILSYAAAGISKATGKAWRDGSALGLILDTATYGSQPAAELFKRFPLLGTIGCWSVIIYESAFPLVLFAPPPLATAMLLCGVLFHGGCAVMMGLNCFFWEFVSTYPIVAWCAFALQQRLGFHT